MYERTSDLLKRKFSSYLLPTILMTMALSLGQIVDSLIVSNFLDTKAFSAVGLCQPVSLCINTVFNFFAVGGATLAAVYKGRKDDKAASNIFSSVIVILLFFSALFMLFGSLFIESISGFLGGNDPELVQYIRDYVIVLFLGCPFIILVSGVIFFVRTDGQPKLSSLIIIVSNAVNLLFDFLLVGVFKVGIIGASVSTVLGYLIGGFLLIKYMRSETRTFKLVKPQGNLFTTGRNTAFAGISSGLNTGLMFTRNLLINMTVMGVAALGSMGVAAFGVCNQTLTLATLFIGGTVQTILPIVGVLYGEEDKVGIRMTVKTALTFALGSAAALCVILELGAGVIASLFNMKGEVWEITASAIRMYALYMPLYAFDFMMINFYQTTQKKLLAGILSVLQGLVVIVPVIMILAHIGDGTKLWFGFVISEAISFGLVWLLSFIYGKRKNLKGLLLENPCNCTVSMDYTIKSDVDDAVKIAEIITGFCREHDIDETKANLVAVAVEEMAVNTAKYGYKQGKKNHIDINLKLIEGDILVRLRDDGVFFNPVVFRGENMEFSGIENIRKIAKEMTYSRAIGFNNVIIRI